MREIKIGSVGRAETIVKSSNLAVNMGSGSLEVFATPDMVALMETSATNAVEEFLESGETSVGTAINISHVSATPLTVAVCATAEVTEVNGREITFKVSASDSTGLIGEGVHKRFVVGIEKFMAKALQKAD